MANKKDNDFSGYFPQRCCHAVFETACYKAACAAREVDQGQRMVFEVLLGLAEQHDEDVDRLISSMLLSAANRQPPGPAKAHQLASALLSAIEATRAAYSGVRKAAASLLWALGMLNAYGRAVLATQLAVPA